MLGDVLMLKVTFFLRLTSEKDRDAMTFPHTVFIAILPLLFYYFLRSRIQLD
jgi:hypothetical protein